MEACVQTTAAGGIMEEYNRTLITQRMRSVLPFKFRKGFKKVILELHLENE